MIDNPFAERDPIVLLPAIRPDVSLFHAPLADRAGNVFIGRQRELATMAHAAQRTLVTVEEIVDGDLLRDPAYAAGVLPAIYVTRVELAPRGAWQLAMWASYPDDEAELARYAAAARTQQGFDQYVADWLRMRRAA